MSALCAASAVTIASVASAEDKLKIDVNLRISMIHNTLGFGKLSVCECLYFPC